MTDAFQMDIPSLGDPGTSFQEITAGPGDLNPIPKALYIAAGGTIDVTDYAGNAEAAVPVVAGSIIPCRFSKITSIDGGAVVYGIA